MNRNAKLILVLIILGMGATACFILLRPIRYASEVETMAKRELAVGSSKAQVEAFLKSKSIQCYDKDFVEDRTLVGFLPRARSGFCWAVDIVVIFQFDKQNSLVAWKAHENRPDC